MNPTTKAEAINSMLAVIGEQPVSTLEGTQSADVAMAVNTLEEVVRELCTEQWHFNTDEEFKLVPTATKEVFIPRSAIQIDVNYPEQHRTDVTIRGNRLYDRKRHTYLFDEPLLVDIRWLFDFEQLPQAARHYVTIRASRKFSDRVTASEVLHSFTQRDEFESRARLEQHEADQTDASPSQDPWTTYGRTREI